MPLPRQVGRYRLSRRIGLGAWGPLFRARVRSSGGGWRDAVVELPSLRRGPGSSALTHHAESAAARLPELRHDHLVRVRALERADDKATGSKELVVFSPFPGVPLHRVVRRAHRLGLRFPLAASLSILQQAAQALRFLAAVEPLEEGAPRGLVHGAVRPAAIFIDVRGRVRLLEAGLRQVLGRPAWSPGGPHAPAFEGVVYLSPEEAQLRNTDGRSDVYSLGLIAYELVTGRPFIETVAGEDLAGTLGRVVGTALDRRVLHDALVDPRGHAVTSAQAAEVVGRLGTMLAKDPLRRDDASRTVEGLDQLSRHWPPQHGAAFLEQLLADYDPEDSGERDTGAVLPPRVRSLGKEEPGPDASQELEQSVPPIFEQLPVRPPEPRPSTLPQLAVVTRLPEIVGHRRPHARKEVTGETPVARPPKPARPANPQLTPRAWALFVVLLLLGWVFAFGVPAPVRAAWDAGILRFAPQWAPQPTFVPAALGYRPVSPHTPRLQGAAEDGSPVDSRGNPWTQKDGDLIGARYRLMRRLDDPALSFEERQAIEAELGRPSPDIPLAHRAPLVVPLDGDVVFEAWLGDGAPECRPELVAAPLHGEYRPMVMYAYEDRWRAVVSFPNTAAHRRGIVYYLQCCLPAGGCPLEWKSASEPHQVGVRVNGQVIDPRE